MTKNEKICKATCDGITSQNLALIARVDADDFDLARELDCTSNGAQYKITDFFDAMKRFEHGEVPTHLTDQMVATTDQLLDKIAKRFDCKQLVQPLGLAFRRSKRVWRIKNPIAPMKSEQYHAHLDRYRDNILSEIEQFVCKFSAKCEKKPKKPKTDRGKGKQTPFMKTQLGIFKDFLDKNPVCASYSLINRARQCWFKHKTEWDAAAKKKIGYACYKTLAQAE